MGEKEKVGFKFNPINLKIKVYDCDKLYNETSDEDYDDYEEEKYSDLSDMSPIGSDEEEVKARKGF